jgi:DNA-binding protein
LANVIWANVDYLIGNVMSQDVTGKIILLTPADASAKITDIVESILTIVMEIGEVNVVGLNDSLFLACSAINMASEIAKVHIDDIDIASIEVSSLGKVSAVSAHLSQKEPCDYAALAEIEDKSLTNVSEQTISVSRTVTIERMLTISLLRLAKFDKIKIVAAGGSINDAIALALKLTNGQISKDPIGIKLFHLHSITMRNDPTKSIAAIAIYLQKGITTRYTKRQCVVLKEIEQINQTKKENPDPKPV